MNDKLLEISTKESIFLEYVSLLLEPKINSQWLQKIANLLRQIIEADFLFITSFIDSNQVVSQSQNYRNGSMPFSLKKFDTNIDKSTFIDDYYVYPLSVDGCLVVKWKKNPDQVTHKYLTDCASLLNSSLKNRTNIISLDRKDTYKESLSLIQNIISDSLELKDQLMDVSKEISKMLQVSRCQVKLFTSDDILSKTSPEYDLTLSTEFVMEGFLESISIVPTFESDWILRIDKTNNDKNLILTDLKSENELDNLLSIKSYIGLPIIYKGSAVGVLSLHQCSYSRIWSSEEKEYLKQISVLLGILVGKENEIKKSNVKMKSVELVSVLSSDEFLREFGHLQVESNVKSTPFSLIMIDIEKLKDINLSMGFVAGNLVLSQTVRYLNRFYGDKYKIARYNSDEFVVLLPGVNQADARLEAEKLKEEFSNFLVLGVGIVEYNFSFVTYPMHSESIADLLGILEQGMMLSKSRGTFQVTGFDEIQGQSKDRWHKLVSSAIPEIILKKSSLKTGPEVLESINEHLSRQKNIYNADILDSVQSLALALDAKDSYTEGHSKRVSEYAYFLAKELGLGLQEIEWVRLAAAMHDIGKIGIPESILCKPTKLTTEEYEIMKKHPTIGARILKPIKPLEEVATLVLYHHEYWDGLGYPHGLKGEDIPVGARIVSIVDAYQAMTSNRPYRSTLSQEEAVKRLRQGAEKQWDPNLIERFISIIA